MDVGVYLESPKTANTILRRWFSPAIQLVLSPAFLLHNTPCITPPPRPRLPSPPLHRLSPVAFLSPGDGRAQGRSDGGSPSFVGDRRRSSRETTSEEQIRLCLHHPRFHDFHLDRLRYVCLVRFLLAFRLSAAKTSRLDSLCPVVSPVLWIAEFSISSSNSVLVLVGRG